MGTRLNATPANNIRAWLSEFENGLSAFKNSPQNSELLDNLIRTTRNIKYAGETLGLNDIYRISRLLRSLEDMMRLIRQNKLNMNRKQMDALSKAVELMFGMVDIVRGLVNNNEPDSYNIHSVAACHSPPRLREPLRPDNDERVRTSAGVHTAAKNREEGVSGTSEKLDIKFEIGRRIKEVRESLELSQAEFGRQIGVPFQHISRYERGEITPGAEMLIKIYKCFNICINWLLTGIGPISIDNRGVTLKKNDIL